MKPGPTFQGPNYLELVCDRFFRKSNGFIKPTDLPTDFANRCQDCSEIRYVCDRFFGTSKVLLILIVSSPILTIGTKTTLNYRAIVFSVVKGVTKLTNSANRYEDCWEGRHACDRFFGSQRVVLGSPISLIGTKTARKSDSSVRSFLG